MGENEEKIKKDLGKLGLYLIENAESEIKEIERKQVLLNSNLKKRKNERIKQILNKKRKQFRDQYHSQINDSTVSILLDVKNKLLDLKNELITRFKTDFKTEISSEISKNYDEYSKYLVKIIKEKIETLKVNKHIILTLNSEDYSYLNDHKGLLKSQKIEDYELQPSKKPSIGGFILMIPENSFIFDYTLENQLNLKRNAIESLITQKISSLENNFYDIEDTFEKNIDDIRNKIKVYLEQLEEMV